jgi:uncharacterized membrane protein
VLSLILQASEGARCARTCTSTWRHRAKSECHRFLAYKNEFVADIFCHGVYPPRWTRGVRCSREGIVLLIVYYVVFMIAGDLSAYFIGLIVEREFGSQASLIVFLALYFLFLWFSWLLAVWMTEPKRAAPAARG